MKRIYLAGPISGDTLTFLENVRRGLKASVELIKMGHAVFSPFLDYQFNLVAGDGRSLTLDEYQANSMAWLEVADAVYVLPGWQFSRGTKLEIDRALELNIPVLFYNPDAGTIKPLVHIGVHIGRTNEPGRRACQ